jgi:exodeoxyribonuclease VII large subunit
MAKQLSLTAEQFTLPPIVSVSQVNRRITMAIERDKALLDVRVRGEISEFTVSSRGHAYFTLKDEAQDSVIRCMMFRSDLERSEHLPQEGDRCVVCGSVGIYEPSGSYQLRAESAEPEGEGDWFFRFRKLKAKLQAAGVFDNHRAIPAVPECIAIVTSPTGAALWDILQVMYRRYPAVKPLIFPAAVQGETAPAALISAMKQAQNSPADLIIIGRGGGSAEDLQAFNDEHLALTIFGSKIPVISAVGHETDFTIADFAADLRAPTPSAAAELATPDIEGIYQLFEDSRRQMKAVIERKIRRESERLPAVFERVAQAARRRLTERQTRLIRLESLIEAKNPLSVLSRGYAAVTDTNGHTVKSADAVSLGDTLMIRLSKGKITVRVIAAED